MEPNSVTKRLIEELDKNPVDELAVRRLAAEGADIDFIDSTDESILHQLVGGVPWGTDINAVKLLLELGADPNKSRPLLACLFSGRIDTLKLLLQADIEVNYMLEDPRESLLDAAEADQCYHELGGNECDEEMLAFYKEAIPLLIQVGAKRGVELEP